MYLFMVCTAPSIMSHMSVFLFSRGMWGCPSSLLPVCGLLLCCGVLWCVILHFFFVLRRRENASKGGTVGQGTGGQGSAADLDLVPPTLGNPAPLFSR